MYTTDSAEILTKVKPQLKHLLEPSKILDYLLKEDVLNQSEFDRCREPQNRADRVEELVNILKEKGPRGYEQFCNILEITQANLKYLLDIAAGKAGLTGTGSNGTASENKAVMEKTVTDMQQRIEDLEKNMRSQEEKYKQQIEELKSRPGIGSSTSKEEQATATKLLPQERISLKQGKTSRLEGKIVNSDESVKHGDWFPKVPAILTIACLVFTVYLTHYTFMNHIGVNYGCSAELASAHAVTNEQGHIINHTKVLLEEALQKHGACLNDMEHRCSVENVMETRGANKKTGAESLIYKDLKRCQRNINKQQKKLKACADSHRHRINTCSIWDYPCETCEKSSLLQWISWRPIYVFLVFQALYVVAFPAVILSYNHLEKLNLHNSGFVRSCADFFKDDNISAFNLLNFCFASFVCLTLANVLLEFVWIFFSFLACFIIFNICLFCYGKLFS